MAGRTLKQFSSGLETQQLLKVTTLYETLADGVRAKALIHSIQSYFGAEMQAQSEFWRFDWLRERSLRSTALGAAQNSAIVIISLSHTNNLPLLVQSWMTEWSQQKDAGACALVLLCPKTRSRSLTSQPVYELLQRAAQAKGVNFICETFEALDAYTPTDAGLPLIPEMRLPPTASPTTQWVKQRLQHHRSLPS